MKKVAMYVELIATIFLAKLGLYRTLAVASTSL